MVNSFNYYYYAAAATALAGILHIVLSANGIGRGSLSGIFFLIAGIAQLFWALPMALWLGDGEEYGITLELVAL
jgi:hypothetical protein